MRRLLAAAWADLRRPGWKFWFGLAAAVAAEAAATVLILRHLHL